MMRIDSAAQAVIDAGNMLAQATAREMELEAGRAREKAAAIRRIMDGEPNPLTGKPHSASSAEAIVEADAGYSAHLAKQRDAVVQKIQAQASYDGAVIVALGLVPPRTALVGV